MPAQRRLPCLLPLRSLAPVLPRRLGGGRAAAGLCRGPWTSIRHAADLFPRNRSLTGTIDAVPAEERFDLVLCSEVIEHVPDPARLFAALAERVARIWTLPNRRPGLQVVAFKRAVPGPRAAAGRAAA